MMVRVVAGLDTDQVVRQLLASLADPDVDSVVIHKPGSHLFLQDGREMVVLTNGELLEERR